MNSKLEKELQYWHKELQLLYKKDESLMNYEGFYHESLLAIIEKIDALEAQKIKQMEGIPDENDRNQ